MRTKLGAAIVSGVVGALALGTPALAADDASACRARVVGSCTTGTIAVNSNQLIKLGVHSSSWCGTNYRLIDTDMNVQVAHGFVGSGNNFTRTVTGLTNHYKLSI